MYRPPLSEWFRSLSYTQYTRKRRECPSFAGVKVAQAKKIWFFTESWGANKGLGEAPKSCTRKEHESATNSIAKRGQGAIAPCRVKGQRPLWGLGQRPNCSAGDQHLKRTQQRRRQRSVPASNFARPQTRPQAALPPRFREEPKKPPKHSRVSEEERCIYRGSYFLSSIP